MYINPLNAKLNPICHLLALLGDATIVVISRLRVNRRFIVLLKPFQDQVNNFLTLCVAHTNVLHTDWCFSEIFRSLLSFFRISYV